MKNITNPESAGSSSGSSQSTTRILGALSSKAQKNLSLPGIFVMTTPAINIEEGPELKACMPLKSTYECMVEVVAGSTWQTNDPESGPKKKSTADVFSLMMRETGLPIAVMLDGCGRHAEHSSIEKLGDELLLFANDCANYVEHENPTQEALSEWVKPRYRALDRCVKQKAEFDASFSLVMMCRTKNGLQAIGIATGDTLTLLEQGNTMGTLLRAYNAVDKANKAPLPFPCPDWGKATLENTLAQLQIVMAPIHEGDRLIMLTDGAYEAWSCKEYHEKKGNCEFIVREINPHAWKAQQSIGTLSQEISKNAGEEFSQLKEKNIHESYGDDSCIAGLTIPTADMQRFIQFRCVEQQIENLTVYLQENPANAHFDFLQALLDNSLDLLGKKIVETPYLTRILWLSHRWVLEPNETNLEALREITDYIKKEKIVALNKITQRIEEYVLAKNQPHKPIINTEEAHAENKRQSCCVM